MVYKINRPLSTETLAESQPVINTNFTDLSTIFAVDHSPLTDPATTLGKHSKISFLGNSPAINPFPIVQEGITMASNISGNRFTLSYIERNSGATHETVQLTAKTAPLTDPNGRSFLPGRTNAWNQSMGMIIQWGYIVKTPAGESAAIPFTPDFQDPPYTIQLTPVRADGASATPMFVSSTNPPTASNFRIINTSSNAHDVYWMAIGREQI